MREVICALLVAILCVAVCNRTVHADPLPNIVLILVDDLGWSDLGCYGHPYHSTPHIDQLAFEGLRFTDAYAPAPICSASRASLLTGKSVPRLGFEFVTKNAGGYQTLDVETPLQSPPLTLNLPLSEQTIAEVLQRANYKTAFFGKWHVSQHYQGRYLAWHPDFGPPQQGFEIATEGFGDHPYAWGRKTPPDLPDQQMPTDAMIQHTVDFISARHEQPYFVMASSFYVHTPVKNRTRWLVDMYQSDVPGSSPQRKERLEYAAFVTTLDHHVGTILRAVKNSPQADNTLIVFVSDNGGHPEYTTNAPLRGSKWNLYEGGIRVPMIVKWPTRVAAHSVTSAVVNSYDLLSTFAELAGAPVGAGVEIDGESWAPLLTDADWQRQRPLVWHFPYYHPEKNFSKVTPHIGIGDFQTSQTRPHSAMRYGQYKLLSFAEDQRVELYDLQNDVGEQTDLSQSQPALTAKLKQQLETYLGNVHARRATRRKD